jgi:hypothetical protein
VDDGAADVLTDRRNLDSDVDADSRNEGAARMEESRKYSKPVDRLARIKADIRRAASVDRTLLDNLVSGISLGPGGSAAGALAARRQFVSSTLESRRPGSLPVVAAFRATVAEGVIE